MANSTHHNSASGTNRYVCTDCRAAFELRLSDRRPAAFCPFCGGILNSRPAPDDPAVPLPGKNTVSTLLEETVDLTPESVRTQSKDAADAADADEEREDDSDTRTTRELGAFDSGNSQTASSSAASDSTLPVDKRDQDAAYDEIRRSIPSYIDGYQIIRELGSGGMGIVYLAWEPALRRNIALKVLRPDLSHGNALKFLREAQVTGQLTHPGIVPVYALGRDHATNLSYYTMKYVTGRGLSDMLKVNTSRQPRLRALLKIFIDLCNAVAFAHSRGVIHCDLKPSNVWVGAFGEVMVLDWGLARIIPKKKKKSTKAVSVSSARMSGAIDVIGGGDDAFNPPAGHLIGTPAYMSPEQARGDNALTIHSDIYSLGVILYEILTGYPPFEGKTLREILDAIREHRIIPPHKRAPNRFIPPELSAICLRALALNPEDRYHSARQIAALVDAFLEGIPQWALVLADGFNRDDLGHHWVPISGKWIIVNAGVVQKAESEGLLINAIPIMGDMAIECEAIAGRGSELSFLLNAESPVARSGQSNKDTGYMIQFGAEGNTCSKIARNGSDVVISDRRLVPNTKYYIRVERVGTDIRMHINGKLAMHYRDSQPLTGRHVGLYSFGAGARFEWVRVYSKGSPLNVSILAVPDAFYSRGHWTEALAEYRHIAETHPNRQVGWMARYKAGLCLINMNRFSECDDEFIRLTGTPMALYALLGLAQRNRAAGMIDLAVSYLRAVYIKYRENADLNDVDEELWDLATVTSRKQPAIAASLYDLALALKRGSESIRRRAALWLTQYYEKAGRIQDMLVVYGVLLEMPGGFERAINELRTIARTPRRLSKSALLSAIQWLITVDTDTDKKILPLATLEMNPITTRLLRGILLLEAGLYKDALHEVESPGAGSAALTADSPPHIRVVERIVTIGALRKLGRVDDALAVIDDAGADSTLSAYHYLIHFNRAECERALGRYEDAVERLDASVSASIDLTFRIRAKILSGCCLYAIGDMWRAQKAFKAAHVANADVRLNQNQRAGLYLGIWFTDSPDSRQALQFFRAAGGAGQATASAAFRETGGGDSGGQAYAVLADYFLNRRPSDKLVEWIRKSAPPMLADELAFLAGEFYHKLKLDKIARKFYELTVTIGPENDWYAVRSRDVLKKMGSEKDADIEQAPVSRKTRQAKPDSRLADGKRKADEVSRKPGSRQRKTPDELRKSADANKKSPADADVKSAGNASPKTPEKTTRKPNGGRIRKSDQTDRS